MSTGVGMIFGADYAVVRIVQDSAGARGELWRYHQKPGASSLNELVVRRVVPRPSPNWSEIVSRLDALGVKTLVVPRVKLAWFDTGELLLESRRGVSYRSVSINAPSKLPWAAARRATIIAGLIDSLDRATPP